MTTNCTKHDPVTVDHARHLIEVYADDPNHPPFFEWAQAVVALADEVAALQDQKQVLESYLDDRLLLRLAGEYGWPHEPDNALGKWCCTTHQEAWRNGTLYKDQQ